MGGITIEGVMLEEYLKDKEILKEEMDRQRLVRDANDPIILHKHGKVKFKERKEPNGKVRILNQIEINKANYLKYMTDATKNNNAQTIFIISIMNYYETRFDVNSLYDRVEKFCKENNLHCRSQMRHSFRSKLGYVKKSALFEYMDFVDRSHNRGHKYICTFQINAEKAKDLSFEDALRLGTTKITDKKAELTKYAEKKAEHKLNIETPEPVTSSEPIAKPVAKEKDQRTVIDQVLSTIKKITETGSFLSVKGDLHIHIHFDK